ncbi:hypothetical protein M6G65_22070 [Methylobacterium tardum]|uniref:hypothetical protein n=1 Tax=Methylobacterium tardum TaxID=374432 RepID=UPI00201FF6B6|nr:hypothetical protein [Methylobacterium tardum]URD40243.1 hypothetical protein M6G65_22070 [Methylobacterium tardum]
MTSILGAGSPNVPVSTDRNNSFQTYVASPKARAAALSAEKKIVQYAEKHPEAVGSANKLLEMLMHFW